MPRTAPSPSKYILRRAILLSGAAFALTSLAGCGFQPVYGTSSHDTSRDTTLDLAATKIGIIKDREGQFLHNLLLDRFNPLGRPVKPLYVLSTELDVTSRDLGVQLDATTTRAEVQVFAYATLSAFEETFQFQSRAVASYSTSESDYAALVAERNAIERSLRVIADDLRLQIATFFEKRRLVQGAAGRMVKIATGAIDGFLRKPPPDLRAVLFYGPDSGLARERLTALALTVVRSLDDPFLVAELNAESVKSDPGLLGDEAAAIALTGGRRVVLIRDAADSLGDAFLSFLDDPVGDALVLVTSGELAAKSKLRKAFEAAPCAAALPCYLDEAGGIDRLIDEGLRPMGVRIDREARHYLVDHLGSDRGVSRSEIEKLALYAGPEGHLDVDTVATLIGDSSVSTMDDVIYAMVDGESGTLDRALDLAAEEAVAPVSLLRMAGNHMLRLRRVQDLVAAGTPLPGAMAALKPPIFFKVKARFEASVKRWSPIAVGEALNLLLEAEAACKRSGAPDWVLCHRTLHQVGALARRQGGRRPGRR